MGTAVDRSRTRSVFYIGEDRKIYEATAAKNTWEMASNQTKRAWPLADDPSSGLAVVSQQSEGKAWLYYWSNKTIVQAYKNYDGDWEDAEALPEKAPKNATDSKKPKNSPSQEEEGEDSGGLSTGAKAGIGVGVGIGALIVGALAWLWMKRRKNGDGKEEVSGVVEVGGSPMEPRLSVFKEDLHRENEQIEPSEMTGQGLTAELDHHSSAVYEMPEHHARE
ncbi:hypothetical protein IL306_004487 [Fusarium sp. DS 682]|nr:hypothetical protein IL306_004487 [Fusarium sp. DS 682]